MKRSDAFPSKYLRASDLGSKRCTLTIESVMFVKLGAGMEKEEKPVVYFRKHEKGLVLNGVNWDAVEFATGEPDSDRWPGHKIVLYATTTEFQGKRVACIRVDEAATATANLPRPAPVPVPAPRGGDFEATDDDVPF